MIAVGHVIANNFRRRHCCRLIGGATIISVVVGWMMFVHHSPSIRTFPFSDTPSQPIEAKEYPLNLSARHFTPNIREVQSRKTFARHSTPIMHNLRKETPTRRITVKDTKQGIQDPNVNRCEKEGNPKRPPEDLMESFEWQRVTEGLNSTYVFSAHYDTTNSKPTVAIVGISSEYMDMSVPYSCHVWFSTSEKAEVCDAEKYSHSESHVRKFVPTFFICHFKSDEGVPYAVSLVRSNKRCQPTPNVLKVSSYDRPGTPEVNFTVCVTPLNYDFDNFRQFVEIVELNRMFGAQRLFFYNFTAGSQVERYFRMYEEEGVTTVIPWKLPVGVDNRQTNAQPEIHYFGQLAALNECLMRNRFRSKYIVFTDLDEVVVPRKHKTWMEMVEKLGQDQSKKGLKAVASFHFRNTFFRTDYEKDSLYEKNPTVSSLQLRSLLTTVREQRVLPHGWRSKHMVVSEAVYLVGIHHIEKLGDYSMASVLDVDEGTALLHHYRSWTGEEASRQATLVDRFMHQFSDTIISRVLATHRKVADRYKDAVTLDGLIVAK